VINVGSVGQPRDRNPHSCYCVLEDGHVHFVRVPYETNRTAEKVQAIGDLDDYLGTRLLEGR
jgi:hypothetical protein